MASVLILKYKKIDRNIFDELLDIRVRVMKESLIKVGRFNEERAKVRLINTFNPETCYVLSHDNRIEGFFLFSLESDFIKLDHLYIDLDLQGKGLGFMALNFVKEIAKTYKLPIKLFALKDSRANDFYLKNGFLKIGQVEFDNIYEFKYINSN